MYQRIIGEPIDIASGILKDKMIYSRWERQQRLTSQAYEIIGQRNIENELRTVPPKIALPIIENASLEENDELQDLWIYFLSSAVDPNFNGTLRTAFIDIIKQLEVIDVHILNFIYNQYEVKNSTIVNRTLDNNKMPVAMRLIIKELGVEADSYKESVDNLIRVRCISSFIDDQSIDVPRKKNAFINSLSSPSSFGDIVNRSEIVKFNVTHIYDKVCITSLGLSFARACMAPRAEENKIL